MYDLKRSVDHRWLFDYWCYIHLIWSCYNTDRLVSQSVLKWRNNGQEYAENSKYAKYAEFAKYTKYAEFAKYTKYAENVLIWTDPVSKRDFPFIEPANIFMKIFLSKVTSGCQARDHLVEEEPSMTFESGDIQSKGAKLFFFRWPFQCATVLV